ncbi:hypothetical protein BCR43DRAFT_487987 [Syncephalastrum racemosum]|uniref:C3H1-type domain-containing protein n=1 Tax=Syncephalastrum racemosum TaxID=13706 RepID=A0A1X2HI49_SYNRA|nr:hypothetical protein BCR43DRAFT_487987 [Syncephalastrum racemosum]
MQDINWNLITQEIHAKCVSLDLSDSEDPTLAEYITKLLQLGRPKDKLQEELQQLVGTNIDSSFLDWLTFKIDEIHGASQPSHARRQDAADERPSRRIFSQAIGSVNREQRPRESNSPSASSSPSFSRRHRERSRSRSPEARPRAHQRREDRDRPSTTSHRDGTGLVIRSSGRNQRDVSFEDTSSRAKPSVFDRLGGAKPASRKAEHRCRDWPSCPRGSDCSYFHPKTLCPDFPNCSKDASECMFIHPATPATQPQQVQSIIPRPQLQTFPQSTYPQQIPMMGAPVYPAKKMIPCRYYPYCSNPACPFVHPDRPAASVAPTAPPVTKRVPVPCMNGAHCTRPGCHFMHPSDEGATPATETVCKYDGVCTRPGCFYKHNKQNGPITGNPGRHKSLVLNKDNNQRQYSVAEDEVVERIVVGESADLIRPKNNGDNGGNDHSDDLANSADLDKDVVMDA